MRFDKILLKTFAHLQMETFRFRKLLRTVVSKDFDFHVYEKIYVYLLFFLSNVDTKKMALQEIHLILEIE